MNHVEKSNNLLTVSKGWEHLTCDMYNKSTTPESVPTIIKVGTDIPIEETDE